MQMNPCPFCGEPRRLGVVTKWMRSGTYAQKRGAYCRCKTCNARGCLVTTDDTLDVRNERLDGARRDALVESAVIRWNNVGNHFVAQGVANLPLFAKGGVE